MQYCAHALSQAGIESAHQEASLLLQHVTDQSLTTLLCNLQLPLSPVESALLDTYLARRLQREPLQYILGHAIFRGRRFSVDARVLIPRPETELLVECVHRLSAQSFCGCDPLHLIDVGTGSGVIAVTLACEIAGSRTLALDISREALRVAQENARRHAVTHQVAFAQGDLVSMIGITTDAIIANLPYVRTDDRSLLAPEIANHEPWHALDGGTDGLSVVRRLCEEAPRVLKPGGYLLLEVGAAQAEDVMRTLWRAERWEHVKSEADLSGIQRVITARLVESPD